MPSLSEAVDQVTQAQEESGKPSAIILAGHNGSGKSTMWYARLADTIQIPLVNADRMMMSILPEVASGEHLPSWASQLRDTNESWMQVAQQGVQAFVAQAMAHKVPFAMETVFSHWRDRGDGTFESKVDLIKEMQDAGYFVILFFVGLSSVQLSIGRVSTRKAKGGHGVELPKLLSRFPRTQQAISQAIKVADAAILTDNSRTEAEAFTVCQIRLRGQPIFDARSDEPAPPAAVLAWLNVVDPMTQS
jgi:predicted ABC-type ATPase